MYGMVRNVENLQKWSVYSTVVPNSTQGSLELLY